MQLELVSSLVNVSQSSIKNTASQCLARCLVAGKPLSFDYRDLEEIQGNDLADATQSPSSNAGW
jgi:hypothetical protein